MIGSLLLGADGHRRSSVTQLFQASADVVSHMFEIPRIILLILLIEKLYYEWNSRYQFRIH